MISGDLGQIWGGPGIRDFRGFPGISGKSGKSGDFRGGPGPPEIRDFRGFPGNPGGPGPLFGQGAQMGVRSPLGGDPGIWDRSRGGPDPGSGICNPCPVFGGFRGAAALLINVFFGQVLVCFSVRGGVARGVADLAKSGVFGEFREFRGNPGFRGIWRFWDVWRISLLVSNSKHINS